MSNTLKVITNKGKAKDNINDDTDYVNQCFWISLLDYEFITKPTTNPITLDSIKQNRTKSKIDDIKKKAYGVLHTNHFKKETEIIRKTDIENINKVAKYLNNPIRIIYYNNNYTQSTTDTTEKQLILGPLKKNPKYFRALDFFDTDIIDDVNKCIYIVAYGDHFELITEIDIDNFKYKINNVTLSSDISSDIKGGRYYKTLNVSKSSSTSTTPVKKKKKKGTGTKDNILPFDNILSFDNIGGDRQKTLATNVQYLKNKIQEEVIDKLGKDKRITNDNFDEKVTKIKEIINNLNLNNVSNDTIIDTFVNKVIEQFNSFNSNIFVEKTIDTETLKKKNYNLEFIKKSIIEGDIARKMFFHNKIYLQDINLLKYIRANSDINNYHYKKAANISVNDLINIFKYNLITTIRNGCFSLESMYQLLLETEFKLQYSLHDYYNNHMIIKKQKVGKEGNYYDSYLTYDSYGISDYTLDEYDVIKNSYKIIEPSKNKHDKIKLINNRKRVIPCLTTESIQENINMYQSNSIFSIGYINNSSYGTIKLPSITEPAKTCYIEFISIIYNKNYKSLQPFTIILPIGTFFSMVFVNNKEIELPENNTKIVEHKLCINNLLFNDKIKCYYYNEKWCININFKNISHNKFKNNVYYIKERNKISKEQEQKYKIKKNLLNIKSLNVYSLSKYGYFSNELFSNYSTIFNMFYTPPYKLTGNNLFNENIHINIPYNKQNIKGISYKFIFNKPKYRLINNIKIFFYIKKPTPEVQQYIYYNNGTINFETNNSNYFIIRTNLKDIKYYECIEFKCIQDNTVKETLEYKNNDFHIEPKNRTKWIIYINKNKKESIFKYNNVNSNIKLINHKLITYYNSYNSLNSIIKKDKIYNRYYINRIIDPSLTYLHFNVTYYMNNNINYNILKINDNTLVILDDKYLRNDIKFKIIFTTNDYVCYFYNYLEYNIYYKNIKINNLYFNINNENVKNKILNISYYNNKLFIY